MSLPRQLRNIYISQLRAIRERLERIELDADDAAVERAAGVLARRDARAELDDITRGRQAMRTPEEIAKGHLRSGDTRPGVDRPADVSTAPATARTEGSRSEVANPLARHFHVLELEDGADFAAVQAKYTRICTICDPKNWPEGSEDRATAEGIRTRVDTAYEALRDALDPTAGRFDKLELE